MSPGRCWLPTTRYFFQNIGIEAHAHSRPTRVFGGTRPHSEQARLLYTSRVFLPLLALLFLVGPLLAQSDAPAAANEVTTPVVRENPIPTKNLLQVIRDGGPLMVPIGICSFALLVFVFERAISLRRGRVIPGPFARRFLQQLHEQQLDREIPARFE